jgi:predicted helicase
MQGVSINIFIKTGNKKVAELGKVLHYDLYGRRNFKYDFLNKNNLESIAFSELKNKSPNYFMIPKNYEVRDEYLKGFSVNEIYQFSSSGVTTSNDSMLCDFSFELLKEKLINNNIRDFIKEDFRILSYKPFDNRSFYLNNKYSLRSRSALIKNYIENETNYTLNFRKTAENTDNWQHVFATKFPIEGNFLSARSFGIPLYLYSNRKGDIFENKRSPNLNAGVINQFAKKINLIFTAEKETETGTFAPIDILDYIYAVLHSPTYRETYKEFLKIDFPRVPFPEKATFWALVKLGGELRQLHLLEFETSDIEESDAFKASGSLATYPEDGDNIVTRKMTSKNIGYAATSDTHGNVWINDTQYFENVPLVAWEFYIGGYQPAQKWLKDRKERELSYEDIQHYGKIIVALTETDRIMKAIDGISIE